MSRKWPRIVWLERKYAFFYVYLNWSAEFLNWELQLYLLVQQHSFFQCAIKKIRYTSRVLAYGAKFGFWSIVSRKIKMLEKNAFLQELLVRIYQKADRRCQIAQQSLKFLLWFNYSGLKACLCFKHFLIPKNRTQLQQWPFKWFISSQLRKQNGAC